MQPRPCTMLMPLPGWLRYTNRKSGKSLDFNPRDPIHRDLMERFLLHPDWQLVTPPRADDRPLFESLLPMGDGRRAVLSQTWPEGVLSAIVFLDPQTGEYTPSSGHFAAFNRPATLISEDK